MKVAILNYKGVVPTSVSGPYDIFSGIGNISKMMNVPTQTHFEVDVVNTSDDMKGLLFNVVGNSSITETKKYDLVLVPAMNFDNIAETLQRETHTMEWIKKQYRQGSEIASMCMGCFLLAGTGLLDGKRAATHWLAQSFFTQMYPAVELEGDKIIVDQDRLCTSGAAYSFTSLMIYLIEKYCGREMAVAVSKIFMIQLHDAGQTAFSIFSLQYDHNDKEIQLVQKYIEVKYNEKLTVSGLAEKFNMSQRTFIRRFSNVTGNTPLEYIQRVRVEAAKRLLETGRKTVEEVCHQTGYEDFNSFRLVFKRFTSLTPQNYRRRYGQLLSDVVVVG